MSPWHSLVTPLPVKIPKISLYPLSIPPAIICTMIFDYFPKSHGLRRASGSHCSAVSCPGQKWAVVPHISLGVYAGRGNTWHFSRAKHFNSWSLIDQCKKGPQPGWLCRCSGVTCSSFHPNTCEDETMMKFTITLCPGAKHLQLLCLNEAFTGTGDNPIFKDGLYSLFLNPCIHIQLIWTFSLNLTWFIKWFVGHTPVFS